MYFNSIFLTCTLGILLPNDWSKDYLVQEIPCLVHLIHTWTGPSPAVQVGLVQGIHLPPYKLVRKSYTPVVPIANTCSIGYLHDGRADNAAYRHDRRADNASYRHDRRADSLSPPPPPWTETSKCNVACDWPEVWADLPRQI